MARAAKKDEAPSLRMVVENGRLVPAFPFDAERVASYRNGAKVIVTLCHDKDRPLVRKWWAILGWYLKNTNLPWSDKETASAAMKIALAMVEPFKMPSGQWAQYPRSLTDIDDAELEVQIVELQQALYDLTGVDQETMRREGGSVGDETFEADQPANDPGDETLAGEHSQSAPTDAGEESTGAGQTPSPPPAGTSATEQPETATEQRENVPSQHEVRPGSTSLGIEQQCDTLGVTAGETAPESQSADKELSAEASPPGARPIESSASDTDPQPGPQPEADKAEAVPPLPASADLSDDDRLWLRQGAKMMLACQPKRDQESYRVLIVQLKAIREMIPKGVAQDALAKMEAIRLHCIAVCKGEAELDVDMVARTALTTVEQITPEPVKVRDAK